MTTLAAALPSHSCLTYLNITFTAGRCARDASVSEHGFPQAHVHVGLQRLEIVRMLLRGALLSLFELTSLGFFFWETAQRRLFLRYVEGGFAKMLATYCVTIHGLA